MTGTFCDGGPRSTTLEVTGMYLSTEQARELMENTLAGRHLHCDQNVDEEADNIQRYMVLSNNTHDTHEHWIDGFSGNIEGALALVTGIDEEWVFAGIYDLQAELLGQPVEITVLTGARAVVDGVVIGSYWEDDRNGHVVGEERPGG